MKMIAKTLKNQKLRKEYSKGVSISKMMQKGLDTCYINMTNIRTGETRIVAQHTGYLSNLKTECYREALIDGFEAIGVKVIDEKKTPIDNQKSIEIKSQWLHKEFSKMKGKTK